MKYRENSKSKYYKFPSLSQINNISLQSDYVAGHWLYLLPYDLFWTVRIPLPSRPTEYQGPSWSWTSVNGAVDFRYTLLDTDVGGFCAMPIVFARARKPSKFRLLSKIRSSKKRNSEILPPIPRWSILNVQPDLVNSYAPCGAVREAVLTIKALSQSFHIKSIRRVHEDSNHVILYIDRSASPAPLSAVYDIKFLPDTRGLERCDWNQADRDPLTFVLLGWKHESDKNGYYLQGLVLEPSRDALGGAVSRFQRRGVFQVRVDPHYVVSEDTNVPHWTQQLPFYEGFVEGVLEIE